ncbi:YigZ family protein [Marinimicrobium sp. C6131]|uniref:IMPACT family protein n=1 Tax=Marinimicrobium sp. C6131 TaxID=3022676 RepID=UPI00223DDDED|nr:YigZ family protein [Marinimicrobium sp. C6131]UZJ45798.1 YigZ family protein [Marinimicrobium sp. C6131]
MNETPPLQSPYRVLAEPCQHTLEEKRSLFHTYLFPVQARDQALAHVEALRQSQPGASHYCWAYILGPADQPRSQAFSDDGEPSGTAGKPMLHVLTQRGAGDTLAVIVRIFGGVKLGAGGLVRAYGGAVSQALDLAQWREITPSTEITITVDFAMEERIRHCAQQRKLTVIDVDYQQQVRLTLAVPQAELDALRDEIQHLTSGQFQWHH